MIEHLQYYQEEIDDFLSEAKISETAVGILQHVLACYIKMAWSSRSDKKDKHLAFAVDWSMKLDSKTDDLITLVIGDLDSHLHHSPLYADDAFLPPLLAYFSYYQKTYEDLDRLKQFPALNQQLLQCLSQYQSEITTKKDVTLTAQPKNTIVKMADMLHLADLLVEIEEALKEEKSSRPRFDFRRETKANKTTLLNLAKRCLRGKLSEEDFLECERDFGGVAVWEQNDLGVFRKEIEDILKLGAVAAAAEFVTEEGFITFRR